MVKPDVELSRCHSIMRSIAIIVFISKDKVYDEQTLAELGRTVNAYLI
jgi:hypothetical protein